MKHTKRSVLAAFVGNMLEWYDFAVFGLLVVIIGKQFFPSIDPFVSTISAMAAFAGAFLARPFGGVIFGYVGDRYGRKAALRLSIISMGVPTVLIGFLPTYDDIGIAAPILLALLRLLQGVSMGGEFISSMVYLSEIAPRDRKYFYSSFAVIGILGGILLGSGICTALFLWLGDGAVAEYGWRIPFLSGIVIIAFGMWMRRNMDDTHIKVDKSRNPALEALRHHKKSLLLVVLLTTYIGVSFHALFIWFPTYLSTIVEPPIKDALHYNFVSLLFYIAAALFGASLADRYGAKKVFVSSLAMFVVSLYPMFWLANSGDLFLAIFAQTFLGVLLACSHALSPLTVSGLFPAAVRTSGLGLAFNAMVAVFSGSAPMVCTYLIRISGDKLAPVYYMAVTSIIAIGAFLWMSKGGRASQIYPAVYP